MELHTILLGEAEGRHRTTDPCRTISDQSSCVLVLSRHRRRGEFLVDDRQHERAGRQPAHGARRAQAPAAPRLQSVHRCCRRKLTLIHGIFFPPGTERPANTTHACVAWGLEMSQAHAAHRNIISVLQTAYSVLGGIYSSVAFEKHR